MTPLLPLPPCLLNCPPLTSHLLLHYLAISGENEPSCFKPVRTGARVRRDFLCFFRLLSSVSTRSGLSNPQMPSPFCSGRPSFKIIGSWFLWGGWFTGRRRRPDQICSVLGGEVEQPLAQQIIVLFQVFYQVGLLLHHLLQIGTLSVTNERHVS